MKNHLIYDRKAVARTKPFDDRCARLRCFENVDVEMRQKLFDRYYSLPNHDEQAAFLAGLISVQPVVQRRPRVTMVVVGDEGDLHEETHSVNPNVATFFYKVRHGDTEIPVSIHTWVILHNVLKSVTKHVMYLL